MRLTHSLASKALTRGESDLTFTYVRTRTYKDEELMLLLEAYNSFVRSPGPFYWTHTGVLCLQQLCCFEGTKKTEEAKAKKTKGKREDEEREEKEEDQYLTFLALEN